MKQLSGFKRYFQIMIGNILITSAYAFITVPNEIVNGGITSFSMVLGQIFHIDLSLFVNGISLFLLFLCYLLLGKDYFSGTIVSGIAYLFFFTVFHKLGISLKLPDLLCVLIAGILVGVGYYLCINAKSTAVSFDVIALILHKKNPKTNIALTMYLINFCVLLFGFFTFGILSVIMGIIFTALQSVTLNTLLKTAA